MKKTLLYSLLAMTSLSFAQNVNIPDANFKAHLVANNSINTNMDSEIQVSEAQAYTGTIECNSLSITDMTGIEAFVNLTKLWVYYNYNLTSIDVSQNTALTELHIYRNGLTSLDVSNNTALVELRCERNPIMSLDVTNLTSLEMLTCGNNGLTSIDVSQNTALDYLDVGGTIQGSDLNQLSTVNLSNNSQLTYFYAGYTSLTTLDVSNNTLLTYLNLSFNDLATLDVSMLTNLEFLYCEGNDLTTLNLSNSLSIQKAYFGRNPITGTFDFSGHSAMNGITCNETLITGLNLANGNNQNFSLMYAQNNSNLTCVEVDDASWSTTNWTNIDGTASFSENCAGTASVNTTNLQNISIYPNPLSGNVLTIESDFTIDVITVYNLLGEELLQTSFTKVDISNLPAGTYLVMIKSGDNLVTKKVNKL